MGGMQVLQLVLGSALVALESRSLLPLIGWCARSVGCGAPVAGAVFIVGGLLQLLLAVS